MPTTAVSENGVERKKLKDLAKSVSSHKGEIIVCRRHFRDYVSDSGEQVY